MLVFIVDSNQNSEAIPAYAKILISLSPHSAMSFAADTILLIEAQNLGLDGSNLGTMIQNYSVGICMGFCALNIVVFFLLALYLDQVFPNEWGAKRNPFFFITCCFRRKPKSLNTSIEYSMHINGDKNGTKKGKLSGINLHSNSKPSSSNSYPSGTTISRGDDEEPMSTTHFNNNDNVEAIDAGLK